MPRPSGDRIVQERPVRGHHLRWIGDQVSEDRYQKHLHASPFHRFERPLQRSLTVGARHCGPARPLKSFNGPRQQVGTDYEFRQALVAAWAMPAVSIRTPAPIVLETLTFRR